MTQAKLQVIEGGACAPLFSFSKDYEEALALLVPDEIEVLNAGLVKAFGQSIRTLFNMSAHSYSSRSDIMALTALAEKRTTFAIGEFGVVCELRIHGETIVLHAVKMYRRAEMDGYEIHNMTKADNS